MMATAAERDKANKLAGNIVTVGRSGQDQQKAKPKAKPKAKAQSTTTPTRQPATGIAARAAAGPTGGATARSIVPGFYGTPGTFIGMGVNQQPSALPFGKYVSPLAPKGHRYIDRQGKLQSVVQRYGDRADWAILAGKDPNQIIDLQNRMVAVGLLKPGHYAAGQQNDKNTRNAFHDLLVGANAAGKKYGDFLNDALNVAKATGFDPWAPTTKTLPPALVIQHDNPMQVKGNLIQDSTNLIGGLHDDPAVFAAKYATQETAAQTAQYNATYLGGPDPNTGKGGSVTAAPTGQSGVDAAIIAAHPDEYAAHQLGQNAEKFISMLGQGPGGGSNWAG